MTLTKCWFGFGFGKGADGLSCRFFSRPPLVLEYCHARIVAGGGAFAMMSDIAQAIAQKAHCVQNLTKLPTCSRSKGFSFDLDVVHRSRSHDVTIRWQLRGGPVPWNEKRMESFSFFFFDHSRPKGLLYCICRLGFSVDLSHVILIAGLPSKQNP